MPREPGPIDFSGTYRVGSTGAGGGRISGSLFFVSAVPEPYLSGGHNAFGIVVEGREIVDKICIVPSDNHKVLFSLVVLEQWLRSTRATMGGGPAASDSGRIHHRMMPPACRHFSH